MHKILKCFVYIMYIDISDLDTFGNVLPGKCIYSTVLFTNKV